MPLGTFPITICWRFVVVVDHLALVRRIVDDVQDYEEARLGHDSRIWLIAMR